MHQYEDVIELQDKWNPIEGRIRWDEYDDAGDSSNQRHGWTSRQPKIQ